MIGHDTIRLYHRRGYLAAFKKEYLFFKYIPIFLRDDMVHLHIPSIVDFCHEFAAEQFSQLTRNDLYDLFPSRRVIYHNNSYKSFRVITKEEFKKIFEER